MGSGASADRPSRCDPDCAPDWTFDFALLRITISHGQVIDGEQVCSRTTGSWDEVDRAMGDAMAVAARSRARRQRRLKNRALHIPSQPADGVVPGV